MQNNAEIESLRHKVNAKESAHKKAKAGYMFNLSASGEVSQIDSFPEEQIDPTSPFAGFDIGPVEDVSSSVSITLYQPISSFGLIPATVKAAKQDFDSANHELKLKTQEITLAVIESFYGVYLADRAVEIQNDEVGRSKLALQYAQKKFEVGQSPKFDVIRSEVALAVANENFVIARKNANAALLSFQRLMGRENSFKPQFTEELEIHEWNTSLDDCITEALEKRPELKQLQAGIIAQDALVAINRLRPSLNLVGNLSYSDTSSSFSGQNSLSWFLTLDIPLFDGGRSRNAVNEAKATRESLKSTLDDIIALTPLEVQTNFIALEEANLRVESSSKIYEQAFEALHMAEVGYKAGVTNYLDLVSTRNQFTQAELNKLKALTDYQISYATLLKSIGRDPACDLTN